MRQVNNSSKYVLACVLAFGVVAGASAAENPQPCAALDLAALEPAPGAIYASARISQGLVFVSGQIGMDPASSAPVPGFEAQMLQALARLERVLAQAGSSVAQIQRATVYVAEPANLALMNQLYRAFFDKHKAPLPARSLVPGLDFGNGIVFEIDVIAAQTDCQP